MNTPLAHALRELMQAECDAYPPKTWRREVTLDDLKQWRHLTTTRKTWKQKRRVKHGAES